MHRGGCTVTIPERKGMSSVKQKNPPPRTTLQTWHGCQHVPWKRRRNKLFEINLIELNVINCTLTRVRQSYRCRHACTVYMILRSVMTIRIGALTMPSKIYVYQRIPAYSWNSTQRGSSWWARSTHLHTLSFNWCTTNVQNIRFRATPCGVSSQHHSYSELPWNPLSGCPTHLNVYRRIDKHFNDVLVRNLVLYMTWLMVPLPICQRSGIPLKKLIGNLEMLIIGENEK